MFSDDAFENFGLFEQFIDPELTKNVFLSVCDELGLVVDPQTSSTESRIGMVQPADETTVILNSFRPFAQLSNFPIHTC